MQGHRKYLTTSTPSSIKGIEVRTKRVKEFTGALVERYKATPEALRSERMKTALMEFGYSRDPGDRLQQHFRHRSSNYLFNLTRAVNMVIWPGRFGLAQFVVLPLFESEMAALAEIILVRCGQGYAAGGNGFTVHPAGQSVTSAYEISEDKWEEYASHALAHSPLQRNYDELSVRNRAIIAKCQEESRQLAARHAALDEEIRMLTEIEELQRRKRDLEGAKSEAEQAALLDQYSEQDRDEVLQLLAEFIYEVMILKDNHRRTQWIMERLEIDAEEGGEPGTLAPEAQDE
ncbi:hypothetical protein W97_08890 [Coniosporium apollinis CBS 100218]|uniref:Uncharacterized protein n=1 Tax=Coniosporium apollinis (strain CBS 100218) TaxID=1168221 RepID=R7Z635_CONA1|nr:uncharacterized protein W97_08890 [Coniosporium apollinis CBS 100218]EON69630.1 hypothetical protein W97_08890 [Coniosporium apollinis CBS 100218]